MLPDYLNNLYALHFSILKYFGIKSGKSKINIPKRHKRLLLVLIDGVGWDLVKDIQLPKIKIHSVFPSSTPTALSSLFFGLSPGEHQIFEKTYIRRFSTTISLPDASILLSFKPPVIPLSSLFTYDTIFSKLKKRKIKSKSMLAEDIANSSFTTMIYKDSEIQSGINFVDVLDLVKEAENRYKFLTVYIPDVDEEEHKYGKEDKKVKELIKLIFEKINEIAKLDKFDIIVTADHGHINIEKKISVKELLEKQIDKVNAIYGDLRALMLETKEKIKVDEEKFLVIDKKRAKEYLFSDRSDLPDYIIVPKENLIITNPLREEHAITELKTMHGGLSKEEIEIPLILL